MVRLTSGPLAGGRLLSVSSHGGSGEGAVSALFCKGAANRVPHHLLRLHLLTPSPSVLGFQYMNLGVEPNIQTVAALIYRYKTH